MITSSESRNSSKNMPRFSSNDMVHNYYLDEARKKTQEIDRNSKTSVMPSTRFQSTANGRNQNLGAVDSNGTASCTCKDDSEPTHGTNVDIPNIYECKQTLDLSASTSLTELESLFSPLFDEYFNGENQIVSKSSVVTTADASDKRQQQPDSTSTTSTLATTDSVDGNFDL
ncbi:hypothetical protein Tco_0949125 [Tanacetum coccineum]